MWCIILNTALYLYVWYQHFLYQIMISLSVCLTPKSFDITTKMCLSWDRETQKLWLHWIVLFRIHLPEASEEEKVNFVIFLTCVMTQNAWVDVTSTVTEVHKHRMFKCSLNNTVTGTSETHPPLLGLALVDTSVYLYTVILYITVFLYISVLYTKCLTDRQTGFPIWHI